VADDTGQGAPIAATELRTFLIADVRGYTRFTREHGDEAASDLAARFAEIVRGAVPGFGGELLELRGDEALCVFGSARQALRAAVELQRRLRTPWGEDGRVFPVGVGVGLDAGEAVATEGGYRGGALNLAARLCSVAAPGQVLASESVVHLSQRVDGVQFSAVRSRRFKGIDAPVRLVEVIPETPLPDIPVALVGKPRRFSSAATRMAVAAAVVAAATVVAIGVMFVRGSGGSSVGLQSNSFGLVEANGHATSPLELDESPFGVAVSGKVAWLPRYSEDAVLAVDTATGQRQSVPVGDGPAAVAVGAGSVWVANAGDGTVSEVNPTVQRVVGAPIYVGNGPSGIAVGLRAVWVALSVDGAVARIDPDTDRVVDTFSVGTDPTRVAVGFGKVWVTNESVGTVTSIDPAHDVAEPPIAVGRGPNGITVGAGAVWVTNSLDGSVSRIDPNTLVANTFPTRGSDTQGIAVVGDTVWVAARRSAEIVRLDAQTGQIRSRLAVGANPQDVAAVGNGAAITTTTSPTQHRGGTLTITTGPKMHISIDPDSYDAWGTQPWDTLAMTNDGLVSLKRVPGPDGETVVADLAKALPTPTDGGLTYAFQLRPGIRYSTGRPVHASDIRSSLERTFSVNARSLLKYPPPFDTLFYGAILGTPNCFASPRSCDLSRGIVVDDEAGMITFHLRHPDPDFLAKLAMPFAVAVPPEAPPHDSGVHPLPATGPYMITRYAPSHGAVLVRNPYFREWSPDAQPDGYPARIVWRVDKTTDESISAVEHGTADWLYFRATPFTSRQTHEIETDFAAQTHPSPYPGIDALWIASNSPLGRDHDARRAIAYAIDRARLISTAGGSVHELPTCQILPPNFPGYRPYCRYTTQPGRTWTAPNRTLAQELARRSPSYGKPVSVFSWYGPSSGRYVVGLLNTLGYRARLVPPKEDGTPTEDPDVQMYADAADYVGAADFIEQIAHAPLTRNDLNDAKAKQSESQYQGTIAWAAADQRVSEFALAIPIGVGGSLGFTSKRVGNFQFASAPGNSPIIEQMWVR
jgi:class 3 adenylate cyclase/ABC-type transport system substrate-binding protein